MKKQMMRVPFGIDVESKAVLRQLSSAHRALAELKGVIKSIPNQAMLIHTLALQEAKDSSAIENIITTHDDLYRETVLPDRVDQPAAKEVKRYASALRLGFSLVRKEGMLRKKTILAIQAELEKNSAGFRKLPGTVLKNGSGEVVYTPPQHAAEIESLMDNLEHYINVPGQDNLDLLVKMALIHFQFESIHPFYDGNGRTGRIINILYLVQHGLLDIPVLYLSRYIVQNKAEYYRLLQGVREHDLWEDWVLYMLSGVEQTARQTMFVVEAIIMLMQKVKLQLQQKYSFYSRELLDALFVHPYTKVEFIRNALGISRVTAMRRLNTLTSDGILTCHAIGRANYYVNTELYELLLNIPPVKPDKTEKTDASRDACGTLE